MSITYEIGEYREINKGALKASFSILEHPSGRMTRQCKLFEKDGRRFWTFPSEEYTKKDGTKGYSVYVKYENREVEEAMKNEVLALLKNAKPEPRKDYGAKPLWNTSEVPNATSSFWPE